MIKKIAGEWTATSNENFYTRFLMLLFRSGVIHIICQTHLCREFHSHPTSSGQNDFGLISIGWPDIYESDSIYLKGDHSLERRLIRKKLIETVDDDNSVVNTSYISDLKEAVSIYNSTESPQFIVLWHFLPHPDKIGLLF